MFSLLKFITIVTIWLINSSYQSCPSLVVPPNGFVICGTNATAVGSVCRIECRKNCQLLGDSFHTCLPNNQWSGRQTQCVDRSVRCRPRLNSPLNGFQVSKCRNWGNYTLHIELYSSINSHSFQISLISQSNAIDTLLRRAQLAPQLNTNQMCCGYICTFGCNVGYTLYGSAQVVCKKRGQWSASIPTCSLISSTNPSQVYCPTLSVPSNGIQSGSCNSTSAIPGSSCVFSCNPGFRLNGESVLVCQSNGIWSNPIPTCIVRHLHSKSNCPTLSSPLNGFYFGNCSPGLEQCSCHFRCNFGYRIIGAKRLLCLNGLWSSSSPICSKKNDGCALPSLPFGAIITSCNTVIGGQCHYQCIRDYVPYSENHLTANSKISLYSICSDNGFWEWPQTLVCRPIFHQFMWWLRGKASPFG